MNNAHPCPLRARRGRIIGGGTVNSPDAGGVTANLKKWGPAAAIGLGAVLAGLLLPQFFSSSAPAQKPASNAPTAKPPASKPAGDSQPPSNSWNYDPPGWPEAPDHQAMFLRLGLGTAVVLALCIATVLICKRWLGGTPVPASASTHLRRIETLSLPQRCWVHLVHVNGQAVLVGGDPGGIRTIVPLPESFSTALASVEATPEGTVFAQRFSATMDATDKEGA